MSARDVQAFAVEVGPTNTGPNRASVPGVCPDLRVAAAAEGSVVVTSEQLADGEPTFRRCRKCGRTVDTAGDNCPRPCGALLPGNLRSLRHGGRSSRVPVGLMPQQADALAALAERRAELLVDLGGADQLSVVMRDLVQRYLELAMTADYLAANLQQLGPLTGKGRTRAALSAWLAVVDRQQKTAQLLGLERRAKPTMGLQAAIAAHEAGNA
jgi:hypothetical protein